MEISFVMCKWILLFVFFFVVWYFLYWTKFFYNPWKLYFFFGAKGSGKSTYFTKIAVKYLRKGYTVYSDSDMAINGVKVFNPKDLGEFMPDERSVLFIDEAGIVYNNRNFKSFRDCWTEFYKLQRHAKCLIFLGSQEWDIDKKVKALVDCSYIVRTKFNCLVCCRHIAKNIDVISARDNSDSNSQVVDTLKLAPPIPFLFVKYCWLPKWYILHDSYALPKRPPLPILKECSGYNPKSKLRKYRRKLRYGDKPLTQTVCKIVHRSKMR